MYSPQQYTIDHELVQGQPYNGRVVNVTEERNDDMGLYETNQDNRECFASEMLQGIQETSPLSRVFFSKENMDRLQTLIRYNVNLETGLVISKQSETELAVVMRAMYLQYSMNINHSFTEQIKQLNELVLRYAVPQITSEAKQYQGYLEEIQRNPVPIVHSVNVSSKGTKTLRSVTSTF